MYDEAAIERLLDRSSLEAGANGNADDDEPVAGRDFMRAFKVANFEAVEQQQPEQLLQEPAEGASGCRFVWAWVVGVFT